MLDTRLVLEVIRDARGEKDTRLIDMTLTHRGQSVGAGGILRDLRQMERDGLIREGTLRGTGPSWLLTDAGRQRLRELGGDPDI